tara:strand:- start:64 stop:1512 length:1449 start_codon:yes stop_codon:yes gene_type:complete
MNIFSTLSNQIEKITDKKITIYVCGVTPYSECHLGHAMSAMVYDTLIRYLRWRGNKVIYVSNYTDIDDKIIDTAKTKNIDPMQLAKNNIDEWEEQQKTLGLEKPNIRPRVTEEIETIINAIEKIIKNGYGYITEDGGVYYSVRKNKQYGELSHRKIDEITDEELDNDELKSQKAESLDFALWKPKKTGEPGWPSPWSEGRPGWHIECSAMSEKYLGANFSIHGGGTDLIFPHHENEIAQAFAVGNKKFTKIWMHNGMLLVEGKKMSKSLGNYISVQSALEKWDPNALRFFVLSAGYRQPTNFSNEAINNATNAVNKIRQTISDNKDVIANIEKKDSKSYRGQFTKNFISVVEDDFNTPKALAILFEMIKKINTVNDVDKKTNFVYELFDILTCLGFDLLENQNNTKLSFKQSEELKTIADKFGIDNFSDSNEIIDRLVEIRNNERKQKNFDVSDRIRDSLEKIGIILKDDSQKTIWSIERKI